MHAHFVESGCLSSSLGGTVDPANALLRMHLNIHMDEVTKSMLLKAKPYSLTYLRGIDKL